MGGKWVGGTEGLWRNLSGNFKVKSTVHFSLFTEKVKMLTRNNPVCYFPSIWKIANMGNTKLAMSLISEALDSSYFVHEQNFICPSASFFHLKVGMVMFTSVLLRYIDKSAMWKR